MNKLLSSFALILAALSLTACGGASGGTEKPQEVEREQSQPETQMAVLQSAPYSEIEWYVENDGATDLTITRQGAGYPYRIRVRTFDYVNHRRTVFVDPSTHAEAYAQLEEIFGGNTAIPVHGEAASLSTPFTVITLKPENTELEPEVIRPVMEQSHLQHLNDFILQLLETQ